MKTLSLPFLLCLATKYFFILLHFLTPDELSCLILTLIYFCALLPLSSFCLSSFSPWPGLMQLLLSLPSCSAALPSICLLPSELSWLFLLCILFPTMLLHFVPLFLITSSSFTIPLSLSCGTVSLMGSGVNTYTRCCAPETWLDVRAGQGILLCYN